MLPPLLGLGPIRLCRPDICGLGDLIVTIEQGVDIIPKIGIVPLWRCKQRIVEVTYVGTHEKAPY